MFRGQNSLPRYACKTVVKTVMSTSFHRAPLLFFSNFKSLVLAFVLRSSALPHTWSINGEKPLLCGWKQDDRGQKGRRERISQTPRADHRLRVPYIFLLQPFQKYTLSPSFDLWAFYKLRSSDQRFSKLYFSFFFSFYHKIQFKFQIHLDRQLSKFQ